MFIEAIGCYDKCIEIYPKYVNAFVDKGYALLELKRFSEAKDCFDRVI